MRLKQRNQAKRHLKKKWLWTNESYFKKNAKIDSIVNGIIYILLGIFVYPFEIGCNSCYPQLFSKNFSFFS